MDKQQHSIIARECFGIWDSREKALFFCHSHEYWQIINRHQEETINIRGQTRRPKQAGGYASYKNPLFTMPVQQSLEGSQGLKKGCKMVRSFQTLALAPPSANERATHLQSGEKPGPDLIPNHRSHLASSNALRRWLPASLESRSRARPASAFCKHRSG